MTNSAEEWVEEEFYFGNAMWPSDARWRCRDGEYQYEVEASVETREEAENLAAGLGLIEPRLYTLDKKHKWVLGWKNGTEKRYLEEKRAGWENPEGGYEPSPRDGKMEPLT